MSYRIAVASSDGINIDQGFGAAKHFYIYEVEDTEYSLIEDRECTVDPSSPVRCEENARCGTDEDRGSGCGGRELHSDRISFVADCRCVLCKKIGFSVQKDLERKGILCFDIETGVFEALEKIVNYIYKTDNHISLINMKNTDSS